MKKTFLYIIPLLLSMGFFQSANAQILERNDLIYRSEILPQSNQLNPAFYPNSRNGYITLPAFNFSLGLPVAYSDLGLTYDKATDKTLIDIYHLASVLDDNKSIHLSTKINLLGFGFHVNKLFFNFDASAVVSASLYFPSGLKSLFDDGLLGNRVGAANAFDFGCEEFVNLISYERFSLGMGYEVNDNLTLGAHINFLNGIANINVEKFHTKLWYSDDAFSTITGTLNYSVLRGGMLNIDMENNKTTFSHSFGNTGMTFDLGAAYELDNFKFSASIIDLGGGIHWQENTSVIHPKRSTINFNGVNIDNLISAGNMDLNFFDGFSDTIAEVVDIVSKDTMGYYYGVPTKIYIGAGYQIVKVLRADMLFHGEWDKGLFTTDAGSDAGNGHFRYNLSLSLSLNLGRSFEFMVANAMAFDGEKGSLFNPGVGLVLAPGNAVQFYLMADYISSFYAVDAKATTIQFGMNACFGTKRVKTKHSKKEDDSPIIEYESTPLNDSDAEESAAEPATDSDNTPAIPFVSPSNANPTQTSTETTGSTETPEQTPDPTNANKNNTPIVF